MKKRLFAVGMGTALLVGLGANAAVAGEVTGNGKSLHPLQGHSACAFSGLDDDDVEDDAFFDRVQSYGQLVKNGLKDFAPSPGEACNPTTSFEE